MELLNRIRLELLLLFCTCNEVNQLPSFANDPSQGCETSNQSRGYIFPCKSSDSGIKNKPASNVERLRHSP